MSAVSENKDAINQVYNIACSHKTSLNELFDFLKSKLNPEKTKPVYEEFRKGDVLHSLADISKAKSLLEYESIYTIEQGLDEALGWYKQNL